MRFLSERAAMSTISLQLYEQVEATAAVSGWQIFGTEIVEHLSYSLFFLKQIFLLLLSAWPLVLLLGWLIWRRKRDWRLQSK